MILLPTEEQVSDYRGAATMFDALPEADALIADKGYDSGRFREALVGRGIESRIPGRVNRKKPVAYDAELYKWLHHMRPSATFLSNPTSRSSRV